MTVKRCSHCNRTVDLIDEITAVVQDELHNHPAEAVSNQSDVIQRIGAALILNGLLEPR